MNDTLRRFAFAFAAAMFLQSASAQALEIGAAAGPVALTSVLGPQIVMENYAERPATAIIFMSSRSEATDRATADLNQLYRKHRLRDVLFVGVSPNPAESGDELRAFAQSRGTIFPLYRDPDGKVAKQFGAKFAPEVYLLDGRGTLVYHGGLQDDAARGALATAIESLLAKRPIALTTTKVEGTPLNKPGPERNFADPYSTIWFAAEQVFEKIPLAPAHHCSTICQAANGDLLCLWYGGSYESADDQAIFLARKRPDDKRWSTPQVLLQNAAAPPGNGVIFRDTTDKLWIVWCRMDGTRPMRRGSGWDRCRLFARTSGDHGATWSEDRPLFDEELWCVPRNPPIVLADKTLLLPVEGLEGKVEGSYFLRLPAGSSSWQRAGFTDGGSQPAVAQRADGSILALLRHAKHITQIESSDGGQTWTKAVDSPLPNPDAGITMTRLTNGHLVLVYNDTPTSRTPLSIARSLDEGRTWEKPLQLESNPGEYSYPCIIQAADGRIHVTYTYRRYTIKHVELNEDWLVHMNRPN
jgi:predicted neuraminidase/peroxiredoxin